jgi:hypothetical protein
VYLVRCYSGLLSVEKDLFLGLGPRLLQMFEDSTLGL